MTSTASRNDRIATSVVRGIFIIASIGLLAVMSIRGQWEAQLRTFDAGTFISQLPNAPIWQSPPVPEYGHFTDMFDSLPSVQPDSSAIVVLFRWDWVAIELLLGQWLVTSSVGVLYVMTRGTNVDIFLHFVLYVAIGLTVGACACVGLWLVLGGWGPPAPLFFAICGLILGIVMGLCWLPKSPSPITTPTIATE
ncbi:hypothetical protein [Novipirellula sp.]|uniref:hypothetical protein n=1 Tax=Novipirellula sp. TaxID=2795430 RepID=UPI0035618317